MGCSTSSLPLMGIGNVDWGERDPKGFYVVDSLPLIGIGNVHERSVRDAPRKRELITPHGDRKRSTRNTARQRRQPCSPHYPSWGSETTYRRGVTRDLDRASLPLMGIGNTDIRKDDGHTASVSLPLMGIGNSRRAASSSAGSTPHYPSWGSETRQGHPPRQGGADLITPHGDRKPAMSRTERGQAQLACSLPLMGIGNLSGPSPSVNPIGDRKRRTSVLDLITPHGDRKLGGQVIGIA